MVQTWISFLVLFLLFFLNKKGISPLYVGLNPGAHHLASALHHLLLANNWLPVTLIVDDSLDAQKIRQVVQQHPSDVDKVVGFVWIAAVAVGGAYPYLLIIFSSFLMIRVRLVMKISVHLTGDGGDGEPGICSATDLGPVEWNPADAIVGHRLLLRSASGVAHISRGPSPQHAQRRLGLACHGTGGRPLDVDGYRCRRAGGDGRLAVRTSRVGLSAADPLDQAHNERVAGHSPFGHQGKSGRPSAAGLAVVVERQSRHWPFHQRH